MTLFLVQHGKARPETDDPERSLTEQGAEIVGRMADWAAQVGLGVDQIRHSGKRRAEQTAMIFAKRLSPPKGVKAVKGLSPKDDVNQVAASLRSDQGSIMLVGHLPHLSRLVSLLLTGNPEIEVVRFRNAGIVCMTQCEPTAHRFVQKFFLPTPHRLLASRPEPTFHPPEMSVQPASLGSGPSLPFAVLRRAWVVCLEEEPGYSGSPGGGDDRS